MKGIYEIMIDKMGVHKLSKSERARLDLFHGHQPKTIHSLCNGGSSDAKNTFAGNGIK